MLRVELPSPQASESFPGAESQALWLRLRLLRTYLSKPLSEIFRQSSDPIREFALPAADVSTSAQRMNRSTRSRKTGDSLPPRAAIPIGNPVRGLRFFSMRSPGQVTG